MKYVHTNIIAKDWKNLAKFYEEVFDCKPVFPERKLSGEWLDIGTGIKNAKLEGIHLRLPGYGDQGPTLEIFSYSENIEKALPPKANREGYGHLAFQVVNLEETIEKVIKNNGSKIGEVTNKEIEGVGKLSFIYLTDPEKNIIEIQNWS
jgi:predicted enzyme related to lactoylglutathione lyase